MMMLLLEDDNELKKKFRNILMFTERIASSNVENSISDSMTQVIFIILMYQNEQTSECFLIYSFLYFFFLVQYFNSSFDCPFSGTKIKTDTFEIS